MPRSIHSAIGDNENDPIQQRWMMGPKNKGQPLTGNLEFTIEGNTEFDGTLVDAWWCPGQSGVKFQLTSACGGNGDDGASPTNSPTATLATQAPQFEGPDRLRRESAGETVQACDVQYGAAEVCNDYETTMTEGMNRLDDYLEATFQRQKSNNDPNTILKRKLLMKNRQIIKRFTDFVKTGHKCLQTDDVVCTDLCYEPTWDFCEHIDHMETFIMERMEDCREPRLDAMGDQMAEMYQLYTDAGHYCAHIENRPEGSGCGVYDSCDNTMLEVITKKFKALMNTHFANNPTKRKAAVAYWKFLIKSFDSLYAQTLPCIDKSEWNCDEFCIDYDSPFQFTNFLDNLFRSRFGTCARYKIWDQRLSKMEMLVDMTDADQIIDQTCSGTCDLEQFDDLLLTRFEDSLDAKVASGDLTSEEAKTARLDMTKQISYLQDSADKQCATNTVAYQCSRACETTLDGQMSAIEWVSKKYLGSCKNYNFRFTKVHEEMRTEIGAPKSVATIGPLFTGQTTCAYTDLQSVYDEYADWSFEYYNYQTGRLIAFSFFNTFEFIKKAAEDSSCVSSTSISCSLIEPGSIDLSDLQTASGAFATMLENVLNTMNNCKFKRQANLKLNQFKSRASKFQA